MNKFMKLAFPAFILMGCPTTGEEPEEEVEVEEGLQDDLTLTPAPEDEDADADADTGEHTDEDTTSED